MDHLAIKDYTRKLGAEECGIASVDAFQDAPEGFHPNDIMPGTRSIIIFGKPFPKGTFVSKSTSPYTMVRNQLVRTMETLAVNLCMKIEESGYLASPIPSGEPYEYWDEQRRHGRAIMSLKHAAQLAGIGRIGKNTLLLNKRHGNRLWLGGVLTNLELTPDPIAESICLESCRICIDVCPQEALNEITIDQKRCREVAYSHTPGGGELIACNKCRVECPYALA
jgi:epoxyqueuosine reductase